MTTLASSIVALCVCGHSEVRHDDGPCLAAHCLCNRFRMEEAALVIEPEPDPIIPLVPARSAAPASTDSTSRLISEGRRSHSKRTQSLAAKIEALLGDLEERLDGEREDSAARREIAALEAKLASLRAKVRGERGSATPRVERPTGERVQCPDCGISYDSRGLGPHRARKHGVRRQAS